MTYNPCSYASETQLPLPFADGWIFVMEKLLVNKSSENLPNSQDRFFNPWRVPLSEGAKAIVADVTHQLQTYESYTGKRKRNRKASDQAIFEASVSAIICDLIHLELTGVGDGIAISRSNRVLGRRSRYRSPVLGKTLPHILDCMATIEMGFLFQQKGTKNPFDGNKQTIIKPDTRLISRIKDHGLTLDGIGLSQSEKVIILRAKKRPGQERGDAVEYSDTEETDRYRAEMQQINEWLEQADINFDEGALERDIFVDITKRTLTRIFNEGSFEKGGRLTGGFWIELKKPERARGLTIDGEGVVILDFGQMAPRILYGLAQATPPTGDLYNIPGLEHWREGVKKLFNSLLFVDKPLSRKPRGTKTLLPNQTVKEIADAICAAHPAIASYFYKGIGYHLQFLESQILVAVLLRTINTGVTALPIHDALVVPKSSKEKVKAIMEETFKEMTGVEAIVEEE